MRAMPMPERRVAEPAGSVAGKLVALALLGAGAIGLLAITARWLGTGRRAAQATAADIFVEPSPGS